MTVDFAAYLRTSTEDNQAPEDSRRWQLSLAEQLINPKGWESLEGLSWDVDGKGLISSSSTQRSKVLLYIDLQGNARVLWEQGGRVGARLRGLPSPDGRHLAITAIALNSNAWMMENF